MTQLERQILQLIESDPMISLDGIAEKIGITSEEAKQQIEAMTEKGLVVGRGFVLKSESYAAVVGGVNIDICGVSEKPLVERDSNPGKVNMSLGGVGRNIAHNMSLLGVDVRFLTAFGDDIYAQKLAASCSELGIDITHSLQVKGGATPTYVYLCGPDGDMALAVSDMEICNLISPDYIEDNLDVLNNAQVVVADTNIPEETILYLAEHCSAPIFADPVSTAKAKKLLPVLGKIHTLKPNKIEAELLSGVKIKDEKSLREAAKVLLKTGLHRVFISCGTDGVLACDKNEMLMIPCCKAETRNTTGAGDAFMAALVWSYLQGMGLSETAKAASAAAAIAVESKETINSLLSEKTLRERMK